MTLDPKLLIELADSALAADYTRVRRSVNALAKALEAAGDAEAARSLRARVRKRGAPLRASGYMETLPSDGKTRLPLIEEQSPANQPIFLNEYDHSRFESFLDDIRHAERLAEKGIAAHLCLLLSGPPGTGKSLLASHAAQQLARPFYVVRLDSAISSLLGDTAKNLRAVFDFVPAKGAVLFLDEMDAIAKLRDDRHELGEIKRVVNTVLQGLDSLDHEAVVIGATNHSHLLDPAIWRRFPYKIELDLPDQDVRTALWLHFLFENHNVEQSKAAVLAAISAGLSGADIETVSLMARRHAVIDERPIDVTAVAWAVLNSTISQAAMPRREGIGKDELTALITGLAVQTPAAEIARFLEMTRQAVGYHLKKAKADAE